MNKRLSLLLASLVILPGMYAHPGHAQGAFEAGLMHPILGLDHLLAMLCVGVLGARLGGRARWLAPAVFVVAMLAGGALAMVGWALFGVESGIAVSLLVLGMAIAWAGKAPLGVSLLCCSAFALFHGSAHGAEMPLMANATLYSLGFTMATAAIHALGVVAGSMMMANAKASRVLRLAGAGVSVAGAYALLAG